MTIDPTVFFNLILILVILTITLVVIVVSHVRMLNKFHSLQKEDDRLKQHEQKKSLEILEDARKKAEKIISSAHFADENLKKEFQEQLKTVSQNQIKAFEKESFDFLKAYQKELQDSKFDTIKIVNNLSKNIEKDVVSELNDFKEVLKKETYVSQKIVEGKIEEEYGQTQKEIEDYKAERIKKVEDQIYNIIQTVAILVLGKAISLSDHETLVIDSLNKAKQEKVFEQ